MDGLGRQKSVPGNLFSGVSDNNWAQPQWRNKDFFQGGQAAENFPKYLQRRKIEESIWIKMYR